jgi:hypothetical protein
MSTIAVTNVKHPSAVDPALVLDADGDVTYAGVHDFSAATVTGAGGLRHIATESFSAVSSVSLNNVFTSDYQNYVVVTSGIRSAAGPVLARLRSGGTDDSNTAYVTQYIIADNTSLAGARSSAQDYWEIFRWDDDLSAATLTFFQPKDATRTVFTSESIYAFSDAYIRNFVGSFTNATSFDGITFYVSSGTITGAIRVYGYQNS